MLMRHIPQFVIMGLTTGAKMRSMCEECREPARCSTPWPYTCADWWNVDDVPCILLLLVYRTWRHSWDLWRLKRRFGETRGSVVCLLLWWEVDYSRAYCWTVRGTCAFVVTSKWSVRPSGSNGRLTKSGSDFILYEVLVISFDMLWMG